LNKVPIGLSAIGLMTASAVKIDNNHLSEWNPIIHDKMHHQAAIRTAAPKTNLAAATELV